MRLIDADALKAYIDAQEGRPFIGCTVGEALKIMTDEQPTIDAVPVRHGKWIDEGQPDDFFPHHAWRCSECGEQVLEIGEPWYKYCPNCGARMDDDETD